MNPNNTQAAGPGALEEQLIAPSPTLEGATEYEVVTIFNPLSVDFIGQVGQSKPVNLPFEVRKDGYTRPITTNEQAVRSNYGLDLKNPDHMARMPIVNKVRIPSGGTLRLQGHEAQVVVRQLVNEVLQREGKRLMLADPHTRHEAEKIIVRERRGINEILDTPQTVQTQIQDGINKLNGQEDEPEFPGLQTTKTSTGLEQGSAVSGNEPEPRQVGTRTSQARTTKTSTKS